MKAKPEIKFKRRKFIVHVVKSLMRLTEHSIKQKSSSFKSEKANASLVGMEVMRKIWKKTMSVETDIKLILA